MSDNFGIGDVIAIGAIVASAVTGQWWIAGTLAYSYLSAKLERSSLDQRQEQGLQANVLSNEASVPVIYGQTRVALKLVDIQQQSTNSNVLGLVGAICLGGEDGNGIDSVTKVYFDDVLAIDGPTATGAATNNTNVQSPWKTGTTFGTDLWVQYGLHLGADGQTHDTELASRFTNWTTADDGRGVAYLALLLYYNTTVWPRGWPKVTADVKGAKLYDTRDASTAWSDNPALAIYDFMTSTKYGMGIPAANINTASFNAAANACDVLVNIPGGGTQKRFTCNGWLDTASSPKANLQRLLSSCRGEVVRIGSEYHLQIRLAQAAESFQLDTTNIVGDVQIWRGGINEVPNLMTATYVDPNLEYQPNDVSWPPAGGANTYLTADNSFVNTQLIDLPFTDDLYRAQQIAQVLLKEARADAGIALKANQSALVLQRGDVVKVTHPTPGWTDFEVWIVDMGLTPDGEVLIVGRQYDSTAYTLTALATKDTPPGTNLPDPGTVAAPTGLTLTADGTTSQILQDDKRVPRIKVAWTASTDPFLASYKIRMKVTAEADSTFQIVARPTAEAVQQFLSDVANGTEYTVEIQAVNEIGAVSAWVSDTVTVATTEAAATGAVTATLNGTTIQVTWGNGTATGARYFAKATEPTLADVQGGTATTSSPVTAYTFASGAELRWVGVLLYTDGITASANESDLYTFPIQYTGAPATLTQGDIQYANATPVLTNLPIGSAGQVLRSNGTIPQWSTSTYPDTVAAQGILYGSSANVVGVFALGAADKVLKVNAGGTAIEWGDAGLSASAAEAITGAWTFRNFQPETDSTYSIGVTGTRFLAVFADEVYGGTKVEIGTGAGLVTLTNGASNRLDLGAGDSLYVPSKLSVGTTATGGALNFSGVLLAAVAGSEILCAPSALATNATAGFLWIPSCAGTPTGVPAGGYSGVYPLVYDSTNNELYIYDGGWISVALS